MSSRPAPLSAADVKRLCRMNPVKPHVKPRKKRRKKKTRKTDDCNPMFPVLTPAQMEELVAYKRKQPTASKNTNKAKTRTKPKKRQSTLVSHLRQPSESTKAKRPTTKGLPKNALLSLAFVNKAMQGASTPQSLSEASVDPTLDQRVGSVSTNFRAAQLNNLRAWIDKCHRDGSFQPRVLLLVGEPGVGKTHFVHQACRPYQRHDICPIKSLSGEVKSVNQRSRNGNFTYTKNVCTVSEANGLKTAVNAVISEVPSVLTGHTKHTVIVIDNLDHFDGNVIKCLYALFFPKIQRGVDVNSLLRTYTNPVIVVVSNLYNRHLYEWRMGKQAAQVMQIPALNRAQVRQLAQGAGFNVQNSWFRHMLEVYQHNVSEFFHRLVHGAALQASGQRDITQKEVDKITSQNVVVRNKFEHTKALMRAHTPEEFVTLWSQRTGDVDTMVRLNILNYTTRRFSPAKLKTELQKAPKFGHLLTQGYRDAYSVAEAYSLSDLMYGELGDELYRRQLYEGLYTDDKHFAPLQTKLRWKNTEIPTKTKRNQSIMAAAGISGWAQIEQFQYLMSASLTHKEQGLTPQVNITNEIGRVNGTLDLFAQDRALLNKTRKVKTTHPLLQALKVLKEARYPRAAASKRV